MSILNATAKMSIPEPLICNPKRSKIQSKWMLLGFPSEQAVANSSASKTKAISLATNQTWHELEIRLRLNPESVNLRTSSTWDLNCRSKNRVRQFSTMTIFTAESRLTRFHSKARIPAIPCLHPRSQKLKLVFSIYIL